MTPQAVYQRAVSHFPLSFAQVTKSKANATPSPSAYRLFHLPNELLEIVCQFLGKGKGGSFLANRDIKALFSSSKKFQKFKTFFLKQQPDEVSFQLSVLSSLSSFRNMRQVTHTLLRNSLPTVSKLTIDRTMAPGFSETEFANFPLRPSTHPVLNFAMLHGKKLNSLSFHSLSVSYVDLQNIARNAKLTSLSLVNIPDFRNDHIAPLTQMKLTSLKLAELQYITNTALIQVYTITTLERLEIGALERVTDRALERISELSPTLHTVSLKDCENFTSHGVLHLYKLINLRTLIISRCRRIRNSAVKIIAGFTELTKLVLRDNRSTTNYGFLDVTGFRKLRTLDISNNELFTSLVFRDLEQIETLTSLNISGCTAFNQGTINHLLKMPNLRKLDVTGCTLISSRAKKYLKRKNPGLKITG